MTLLEQLQHIKSVGEHNRNDGICLQLQLNSMDRETLAHLMFLWPKHSGDSIYPIPSTKKGLTQRGCSTVESVAIGQTRTPTASCATSCLTS